MNETKENVDKSDLEVLTNVISKGDISKLTPKEQAEFLHRMATSQGLDPFSQPYELIKGQDGKKKPYPTKSAAYGLKRKQKVSLKLIYMGPYCHIKQRPQDDGYDFGEQVSSDTFLVVLEARTPEGVVDYDIGVGYVGKNTGQALETLFLKTMTKAKRRLFLSSCGVGTPDAPDGREDEGGPIPEARVVSVAPERDVPPPSPASPVPASKGSTSTPSTIMSSIPKPVKPNGQRYPPAAPPVKVGK